MSESLSDILVAAIDSSVYRIAIQEFGTPENFTVVGLSRQVLSGGGRLCG